MASKLLFGSKLGLKNNPPRPKRTRRHHHLYPCCITVPTSTYSEGTYVVSIQNPRWTQMPCIPLSMLTQHTRHLVLTYYIFFSFSPAIPFIFSTLRFPLTPSRNSDPGSHSRLFSPLSTACRAFHFHTYIARRRQPFLASSTRVELRVPTLGALSS